MAKRKHTTHGNRHPLLHRPRKTSLTREFTLEPRLLRHRHQEQHAKRIQLCAQIQKLSAVEAQLLSV